MGATEIKLFLTHLAIAGKESASTRNRLRGRWDLYRQVLEINELWLTDATAARRGKRLPGLLTMVR